jgi:hypothetical protein
VAIIIIGGHARNVGKTSVAAAIVSAWPECCWTAVKISSHWHDGNEDAAEADPVSACRVDEELQEGNTDTGRYLAAGAARSYWVRVRQGRMEECLPQMMPVLRGDHVVVESNAIARFLRHDLFLMVYRRDVAEFKKSALEMLPLIHAVVAVNCVGSTQVRESLPPGVAPGIPIFPLKNPQELTPELARFIKSRLDQI